MSRGAPSFRRALPPREAIRMFLALVADARGAPPDATEAAHADAIVRLLGRTPAALALAAARSAEVPLAEMARGLADLDRGPTPSPDARARLAHADAARLAGRLTDAARELESIAADDAADTRTRAEAHALLGAVLRSLGHTTEALEHKQRAVGLLATAGDPLRRAIAHGEVGTALAALGRLAEARAAHEEALAVMRDLPSRTDAAVRRAIGAQLSYLGVALHRAGLLEPARRAHEEALAVHRETAQRRLEGAERMHLGHVARESGDLELARRHLDEALVLLRDVHDRALEGVALGLLGAVEVEAGRLERSGALLRRAMRLHTEAGSDRHAATTWVHLASHHTAVGDEREARASLDRAIDVGGVRLEPELRAWVLALRGELDASRAIPIEDPGTRRAIEIVAGAASLEVEPLSSRVRHALAIATARAEAGVTLVAGDGQWFSAHGKRVDLGRRGPLRRVLASLARAKGDGASATWQALLAAGWPGERVLADAGFARVRNALFQLRKLGLSDAIETRDDGWRLRPTVAVRGV